MGQRENYYPTASPPTNTSSTGPTVRTVLPKDTQKTDQHRTRSSLSSPLLTNSREHLRNYKKINSTPP